MFFVKEQYTYEIGAFVVRLCVCVSVCLFKRVRVNAQGWALHVGHFCRPDSSMDSNQTRALKKSKVSPTNNHYESLVKYYELLLVYIPRITNQ